MIDIISRRKWWYIISASVLIPGLIVLSVFGLRLGIDFVGGSVIEISTNLDQAEVVDVFEGLGIAEPQVVELGDVGYQVRFIDELATIEADIAQVEGMEVLSLDQVGPSVSRNLTINTLWSLLAVSLAITIYIAFAFRNVEHPGRFGAIAIVTLLHDALFVMSLFAVFGRLLNIEVDSFIVTAVLTVIGFSVHDTIVVFDRTRENLLRKSGDFAEIINGSINEVMGRSINTSITTILVLLALFLLGGSATSNFILALLLGMVSGTYSSIFIAAPLLVTWHNRSVDTKKAD